MPFTTGSDTVSLSSIDGAIDGLDGDDLLILTHPATFQDYPLWLFDLRAPAADGSLRLVYVIYPGPGTIIGDTTFAISNIERFDVTTPDAVPSVVITGGGDDTLRGGTGSDTLSPGGGRNLVYGGDGDDVLSLSYGEGVDHVYGGNGSDRISGAGFDDIIDGGGGTDTLVVSLASFAAPVNTSYALFSDNPNWSRVERFEVTLTGHDDIFRATTLRARLDGGGGDDLLILNRTGLNAIDFRMGISADVWGFERLRFIGSDQKERVNGTAGNDTLGGGGGNDTLASLGGSDQIFGGSGRDSITGVDLGDTVGGGAGFDVAVVDFTDADAGVVVGHGNNPANFSGIEEYQGILTPFDDVCYLDRISAPVEGGGGRDRLVLDLSHPANLYVNTQIDFSTDLNRIYGQYAKGFSDFVLTHGWEELDFTGTAGSDSVQGGGGDDTLRGQGGRDALSGGGGNDILYGGSGIDNLYGGGTAQSECYGGADNDAIFVSHPDALVDGGRGVDLVTFDFSAVAHGVQLTQQGVNGSWSRVERVDGTLTGHDDTASLGFYTGSILGGAGNDTLIVNYSAPGRALSITAFFSGVYIENPDGSVTEAHFQGFETVQVSGTARADTMGLGDQAVRFFGNEGNDSLTGGNKSDLIEGGIGDDTIDGDNPTLALLDGIGQDTLRGGAGIDIIFGGFGDDLVEGGDDGDGIEGGLGNDLILGGLGSDLFFFRGSSDSGQDRIADYIEGEDVIWISGGLRLRDVSLSDVGTDKLVSWANGSVLLDGMAGHAVRLYFDQDFV